MDQIKPSFEELEEKNENLSINQIIKEKNKKKSWFISSHAVLIGLDKITAKSNEIVVSINEAKNLDLSKLKF